MPTRLWFPLDVGFLHDNKISELGAEYGPGGPLTVVAILSATKAQEEVEPGRLSISYKNLARAAFLPSSKRAREIVARASELRVVEMVEMDNDGFTARVPSWGRWQPARLGNAERQARHRERNASRNAPSVTNGITSPVTTLNTETTTPHKSPHDQVTAEFEDWLAHHAETTGSSPPKRGTKAKANIAAMFRQRRQEGYGLDELRAATLGAFNDPNRRENGWYDPESVLRPTKVHKLIEKGKQHKPLDPEAQRLAEEKRVRESYE